MRFVEVTYPRTLTWSLLEYATGVQAALARQGITQGWLLGESFGSQVVWPLAAHPGFRTQGVVLAGGFARHPMPWGARLGAWLMRICSLRLLTTILRVYGWFARLRFRSEPEVRAGMREFIARRTDLDRRAAMHRLRLVAANNPSDLARAMPARLYGLSGWLDPIVPWPVVRGSLRRVCPTLQHYRVVWGDHNVLSTASAKAAEQVLRWMGVEGTEKPPGD